MKTILIAMLLCAAPVAFGAGEISWYSPGLNAAHHECAQVNSAETGFTCQFGKVVPDSGLYAHVFTKRDTQSITAPILVQLPISPNASKEQREQLKYQMSSFLIKLHNDGLNWVAVHWAANAPGKLNLIYP